MVTHCIGGGLEIFSHELFEFIIEIFLSYVIARSDPLRARSGHLFDIEVSERGYTSSLPPSPIALIIKLTTEMDSTPQKNPTLIYQTSF